MKRRRSIAASSRLKNPILNNEQLERIKRLARPGLRSITLSTLYRVADGEQGLREALDDLCRQASRALEDGYTIIVLSDRGVNHEWAPIPSLLATGGGPSPSDPRRHPHQMRTRRGIG